METGLVTKPDSAARMKPARVPSHWTPAAKDSTNAAFFWLASFYLVYCARPEDWVPGLRYLPLAKITAICALIALLSSAGKSQRKFRDRPKEANYLLALILFLFVSGFLSPVWKGGAVVRTLDFSKVFVAWALTFLVITTFARLRRIIFVQAASVAVIAVVSIVKGYNQPRLEGVLGGIYSNPNDLAFAIVLSLPFCLAFLVSTSILPRKLAWSGAILVMVASLFLTASRAGFIDLIVAGSVCLWHFAIKGRRLHLIVVTLILGTLIMAVAGRQLKDRFGAISGTDLNTSVEGKAYSSFQAREYLMRESLSTIEHYPLFGVGVNNFITLSGDWHEVHMTYLQIAAEGGIPGFVLYVLFFACGFANLRKLRRRRDLDSETTLFVGALHSSLIGFVVGALFAPEAYQFFPYFAVAYTSVLLAIVREREREALPTTGSREIPKRRVEIYGVNPRAESFASR